MTKINLLPGEMIPKREILNLDLIVYAWIILAAGIIFLVYSGKQAELNFVDSEIAAADKMLEEKSKIAAQVDELKSKKAQVENRIMVIGNLLKDRLLYPVFLQSVAKTISELPGVWLSGLPTTPGENQVKVSINCTAADHYKIADMLDKLMASDEYKNPEPQISAITQTTVDNKKFRQTMLGFTYTRPPEQSK